MTSDPVPVPLRDMPDLDLSPDEVTITVVACARCGQTHPVVFRRLRQLYTTRDTTADGRAVLLYVTHRGRCPVTNLPMTAGAYSDDDDAGEHANRTVHNSD